MRRTTKSTVEPRKPLKKGFLFASSDSQSMPILEALRERWEQLSDWLRERNIPPVIVPIILILVLAGAAYLLFFQKATVAEFRVLVQTDKGEKVDGAIVEVYDDGKLIATETSANGVAVFKNLPARQLQFKISKEGRVTLERAVDLSQRASTLVGLSSAAATPTPAGQPSARGFRMTLTVINANTGAAIEGAKVDYSFGSVTDSAFSDAGGVAVLDVPKDATVRVKAIHPDYKTKDTTLLATKASDILSLSPKKTGELFLAGLGKLVVIAQESSGAPVSGGTVKVYDAATSALLNASTLSVQGRAEISLSLPAKVTVSIDAPGYLPYSSGSVVPIEMSEFTTHMATLAKATAQNSNVTKIKTVDGQAQGVKARVLVYAYPTTTLMLDKETDTSGNLDLTLAKEGAYYAVALKSGSVTAQSSPFTGGVTVTLTLNAANASNSGSLNVTATDKKLTSLIGATVLVLTSSGLAISLPVKTDANGNARFDNLPLGINLVAVGKRFELSGETSVEFDSSQGITLTLLPQPATIDVSGMDLSTRQGVTASFVARGEDGAVLDNCNSYAGASCRLEVAAEEYVTITGASAGFGNASATVYLKGGEAATQIVNFIPSSLLNETLLVYEGVFDPTGVSTKVLRPGGLYTARFTIGAPAGVDAVGFSFRIGDKASVQNESLGITDFSGADWVARSTTWNPGPNCSDIANSEGEMLKWAQLEYNGSSSRSIEVSFEVLEDATPQDVPLYYRAYSRKGLLYSYNPADARLGNSRNSSSLDGCYAGSRSDKLQVVIPGQVSPPPSIVAEFTPSARVAYDPVIRRLVSDVTELALQVDPIFPKDALPLNLSTTDVLVEAVRSNATGNGTAGCYRFDAARKLLVFESGDTNPACPIKTKGNSIESDDSASIRFAYVPDPTKDLILKIKLVGKSVEPVKSLYVKPESADGEAARVFYMINERQGGTRTVTASYGGGEREFAFDGPGAQAIAWRGPGDLSFGEGGEELASATYTARASYFKDRGGMGGAMVSSNCNGFLCCAEGWCTSISATKAFEDLKVQADSVASQTAFRRGSGEPWKSLAGAGGMFDFVSVVQLKEGASLHGASAAASSGSATAAGSRSISFQEAVEGTGLIAQPLPTGCTAGNPQVVEVRATSADGLTWVYTSSPMRLYTVNYLTGACPAAQVEAGGAGATGTYLPLCNFLYGDGECVVSESDAALEASAQFAGPAAGAEMSPEDEESNAACPLPYIIMALTPLLASLLGGSGGTTVAAPIAGVGAGAITPPQCPKTAMPAEYDLKMCDAKSTAFKEAWKGADSACPQECKDTLKEFRAIYKDKPVSETAIGANTRESTLAMWFINSANPSGTCYEKVEKARCVVGGAWKPISDQCYEVAKKAVGACKAAVQKEVEAADACDSLGGAAAGLTCYSHPPNIGGDANSGTCVKTCRPVCALAMCTLSTTKGKSAWIAASCPGLDCACQAKPPDFVVDAKCQEAAVGKYGTDLETTGAVRCESSGSALTTSRKEGLATTLTYVADATWLAGSVDKNTMDNHASCTWKDWFQGAGGISPPTPPAAPAAPAAKPSAAPAAAPAANALPIGAACGPGTSNCASGCCTQGVCHSIDWCTA